MLPGTEFDAGLEKAVKQFEKDVMGRAETGIVDNVFAARLDRFAQVHEAMSTELTLVSPDTPATEEQVWARHILVDDEKLAKDIIANLNGKKMREVLRLPAAEKPAGGRGKATTAEV